MLALGQSAGLLKLLDFPSLEGLRDTHCRVIAGHMNWW